MKPDFYYPKYWHSLTMSAKQFIIFIFLNFVAIANFAQVGSYFPTFINADLIDTAHVSLCQFPYHVSKAAPAAGDSINWRVIKGQALLYFASNTYTEVRDMKPDTCVLVYTVYSPAKVLKGSDTLTLINNRTACQVIDRVNTTMNATCGTPITILSRFQTNYYTHMWTVSSNGIITNPFATNGQVTFSAAGSYMVYVTATSASGYNRFTDGILVNVSCPTVPVTRANVKSDTTIAVCKFPITLPGNIPATGETVKWEAITGAASFQSPTAYNAKLLDATNGAKLKYTITNGSNTSSDTLTVYVNTSSTTCDPIVMNPNPVCGDSIVIDFAWGAPIPGYNPYSFSWTFPLAITPSVSNPTNSVWARVVSGGNHQVRVVMRSPYNFNTFTKIVNINATCPPVNPVTVANAGGDTTILPCMFPFTLNGNAPKAGETVKWELVSGTAVIMNDSSPNATIADAISGARLRYVITNGTHTSIDTMTLSLNFNSITGCQPDVETMAPNCGDTTTISFPWVTIPMYTYNWSVPAGVRIIRTLSNSIDVVIMNSGAQTIVGTFKTPYNFNTISKTIILTPQCTPITTANAGPDAFIYCGTFQLSANRPATGETGVWSVISGNASVDSIHNPTSLLSVFSSGTVRLIWTISNGSRVSVDTVTFTASLLRITGFTRNNVTCLNNGSVTVNVTGGLPPYTYQWQGGHTGRTLSNVPAGFYMASVRDQSGCIAMDSVSIADSCATNTGNYLLTGTVKAGNQNLPYGFAILMQNIGGLPIPVKTTNVVNGYYLFTGLQKADYIVYIIPYQDQSMTTLHSQYLPTFYVNKVSVIFANPIHVVGNTYGVDIRLVAKRPTTAGLNTLTATIDLNTYTATPVLPVLLFDSNDSLVASGVYDGSSVSFDNLASGSYYIAMSIDGLGYKKSGLFYVSADGTKDIELVNGKLTGTQEEAALQSVNAFPNPFEENVTINTGELKGVLTISILEVSGREVKKVENITSKEYQLDTQDLPKGFYILQISNGELSKNIQMIKK